MLTGGSGYTIGAGSSFAGASLIAGTYGQGDAPTASYLGPQTSPAIGRIATNHLAATAGFHPYRRWDEHPVMVTSAGTTKQLSQWPWRIAGISYGLFFSPVLLRDLCAFISRCLYVMQGEPRMLWDNVQAFTLTWLCSKVLYTFTTGPTPHEQSVLQTVVGQLNCVFFMIDIPKVRDILLKVFDFATQWYIFASSRRWQCLLLDIGEWSHVLFPSVHV